MTHIGAKPFACTQCEKTFAQKAHLDKHIKSHLSNSDRHTCEKPFSCDLCGQAFSNKGNLKRHELNHTGARPFACPVCEKTFAQKGNLDKHVELHEKNGENQVLIKEEQMDDPLMEPEVVLQEPDEVTVKVEPESIDDFLLTDYT